MGGTGGTRLQDGFRDGHKRALWAQFYSGTKQKQHPYPQGRAATMTVERFRNLQHHAGRALERGRPLGGTGGTRLRPGYIGAQNRVHSARVHSGTQATPTQKGMLPQ